MSLNKVMVSLYEQGWSLTQISREENLPVSTVRSRLLSEGVTLRNRVDGVRIAARQGRLSNRHGRAPSRAAIEAAVESRRRRARGYRVTSSGYIEFTTGEHKGRSEHVVVMEQEIGRPLFPGEHVHHVNGVKTDNRIDNLVLLSISEHASLHGRERAPLRIRDGRGMFMPGEIK